ncbi:hypothetical protein QAD02_005922 [Eretmocerus hayati]|uniref:Uncharacterized protein n=1 Tax=Eretmocerus hayati TaxID=131215 RepID=A0ACC2N3K6_9HYME|nr:hypothetical protein QAD02_005922 [Eretmocerus hayati]
MTNLEFHDTIAPNITPSQPKICLTDACRSAAETIQKSMNPSINPCEDFYQYACGNYMKNSNVLNDKIRFDLMDEFQMKIHEQIRHVIENKIENKSPQFLRKLSSYYKTCMDEERVERNSEKEFRKMLTKLGGWPVLQSSWNESNFDWKNMIYRLRDAGLQFDQFINIYYENDLKNNSRSTIHLDGVNLGLEAKILFKGENDDTVKAYFNYMVNFAVAMGANFDQAVDELSHVRDFEIEIAKIRVLVEQELLDIEHLYNPVNVSTLEELCPQVPWKTYISRLFPAPKKVDSSDRVIIKVPGYLERYCCLLESTPKRTLANYALWKVASSTANRLSSRIRNIELRFYGESRYGNASIIPLPQRKELCMSLTFDHMPLATAALFIRKHFNKESKKVAMEMIDYVRYQIRSMIEKSMWMQNETRLAAIEKLDKMKSLVAYPDQLLDDKILDAHYRNFIVYTESFLKTELSFGRFKLKRKVDKIRKPIVGYDWTNEFGSAASVNAFYVHVENVFMILGGILSTSYFNVANPKYVNYGGIGTVIGHEIMHGFDNIGRRYDKRGNLMNWWDLSTEVQFRMKALCFVHQYYYYGAVKNMAVEGTFTLSENLADNVGIRQAYLAYDRWANNHKEEDRLPGLEHLTPRQTFWLAYANTYCTAEKQDAKLFSQEFEPSRHAPNQLRVHVPLTNIPEFAQDFGCPYLSPMNPPNKCVLW